MVKVRTEKRYNIDWIKNGFCYRTTMDCPYSYVKKRKADRKGSWGNHQGRIL